ncbi:MAG: NifU family protein [Erysipelotrichaceae bacterium]|nr:NifU family protein [Erysipelotrichaceae bacterium]
MNEEETIRLIEATLDKIRPFLQRDGGDVDFIGFRDGIVYVTMVGACQGCSFAQDDISAGVEIIIMEEVPGVLAVKTEDVPEDMLKAYLEKKAGK